MAPHAVGDRAALAALAARPRAQAAAVRADVRSPGDGVVETHVGGGEGADSRLWSRWDGLGWQAGRGPSYFESTWNHEG